MKSLSSHEFANSFFYAASGTDLQPLIRFSYLCDTFIYVSVGRYLDPATVIQSVKEKTEALERAYGPFLELSDDTLPTHLDELEQEYPAGWQRLFPEQMLREYREVFGSFAREENWGFTFEFGVDPV